MKNEVKKITKPIIMGDIKMLARLRQVLSIGDPTT